MHKLTHKIETSELEAGDHIYSYRAAFVYSHHGIYIGENKVVHFTSGSKASSSVLSLMSSSTSKLQSAVCSNCDFGNHKNGVTLSCLDCFLGEHGSLFRYKYGVSKHKYIAKVRGGSCTTAQSSPPQLVIHRANFLLENGFAKYNLFEKNCEDFALYCKTALIVKHGGCSGQIKLLTDGIVKRYKADIGVRNDVDKVEVEDLASYLENL
ncbi:hypothetical protein BUALT_Bualt10G0006100 [Buddleja alternifolia]|uniref:LRAT domain-containing protein n=1 Tax=Buddleja alternifolia TaxID=168488 RepID=A0AAV6X5V6_9LAMI|nr:hypothetical protein BUALT_Bualt10G0006100 [Buddleja alternifolia]